MLELGAVVGIVADHGMNDKCTPDGQPQVVYLEEALNDRFGPGSVRVICPITDPFVKHHGALGSFVRVYATGAVEAQALMDAAARIPAWRWSSMEKARPRATRCRPSGRAISSR